jgi:small GTP-binding protein
MDGPAAPQPLCIKAVLLGDSGVGKTSLATRWSAGVFVRSPGATIGASHHRRQIHCDGEPVDVFLWDTAGQEAFQSLTPLYVRGPAVAIVVTTFTDIDSFRHIHHWVSLIVSSADTLPPVLLAVGKIDADAGQRVDDIHAEHGGQFAARFFVSAMTGEGQQSVRIRSGRGAKARKGVHSGQARERGGREALPLSTPGLRTMDDFECVGTYKSSQ